MGTGGARAEEEGQIQEEKVRRSTLMNPCSGSSKQPILTDPSSFRWGKKVKKGKGVKKGKKGKKFLKDKGHKNTGFKTVYHKEEWGKSSKVSWFGVKRISDVMSACR